MKTLQRIASALLLALIGLGANAAPTAYFTLYTSQSEFPGEFFWHHCALDALGSGSSSVGYIFDRMQLWCNFSNPTGFFYDTGWLTQNIAFAENPPTIEVLITTDWNCPGWQNTNSWAKVRNRWTSQETQASANPSDPIDCGW